MPVMESDGKRLVQNAFDTQIFRQIPSLQFAEVDIPYDLTPRRFALAGFPCDSAAGRPRRRPAAPSAGRGRGSQKTCRPRGQKRTKSGVLGSFRDCFSHRGILSPAKAQVRTHVCKTPFLRGQKYYPKPRKTCTFASRTCTFFRRPKAPREMTAESPDMLPPRPPRAVSDPKTPRPGGRKRRREGRRPFSRASIGPGPLGFRAAPGRGSGCGHGSRPDRVTAARQGSRIRSAAAPGRGRGREMKSRTRTRPLPRGTWQRSHFRQTLVAGVANPSGFSLLRTSASGRTARIGSHLGTTTFVLWNPRPLLHRSIIRQAFAPGASNVPIFRRVGSRAGSTGRYSGRFRCCGSPRGGAASAFRRCSAVRLVSVRSRLSHA